MFWFHLWRSPEFVTKFCEVLECWCLMRLLSQLMFGISHVRYHKKRHNFLDTPSDRCHCNQGIEDLNHFLFICPSYTTHRTTLINMVSEILQKYNLNHLVNHSNLYLYGHRSINSAENRKIISSTITFQLPLVCCNYN